jgi:hypothetical protein
MDREPGALACREAITSKTRGQVKIKIRNPKGDVLANRVFGRESGEKGTGYTPDRENR